MSNNKKNNDIYILKSVSTEEHTKMNVINRIENAFYGCVFLCRIGERYFSFVWVRNVNRQHMARMKFEWVEV